MRTSKALLDLSKIGTFLQVAMSCLTERQRTSRQLQRDTWVAAVVGSGSPMER